ncbi:MAG: hypothetical protein F6K58_19410 [Symploca sp. SIO2E9]|nr:hypothetical protein [Symploca sp. SIO2E9]
MAAQSAQQSIKSVVESIAGYNGLSRLKQLSSEYGIVITITEEANTSA